MKTAILTLSLVILTIISAIPAEVAEVIEVAEPPDNVFQHYMWCAEPKDSTTKIYRYHKFWSRYRDAAAVNTYVRRAAYRLVLLYAENNQPKELRATISWLETNDQAIAK